VQVMHIDSQETRAKVRSLEALLNVPGDQLVAGLLRYA
jgi:hypothetical protein